MNYYDKEILYSLIAFDSIRADNCQQGRYKVFLYATYIEKSGVAEGPPYRLLLSEVRLSPGVRRLSLNCETEGALFLT
jgi:hypothetical protein